MAGRKREEETARSDFWRKVERVAVFVVLGSSMELGVSSSLWAPIVVGVFWFLWCVAGEMGFFGGADRMLTAVVAGMGKMNDEMEQGDSDVRIRYTMHRWPEENMMVDLVSNTNNIMAHYVYSSYLLTIL